MIENNIVIYQTKDGQTDIDVRLENETVLQNMQQFNKRVKDLLKEIWNITTLMSLFLSVTGLKVSWGHNFVFGRHKN